MGSSKKTLVIGSTGHSGVTCVAWTDVESVNVVDFDQVVLNCRPLTTEVLNDLSWDFFDKVRKQFVRLLDSRGRIIAIGMATQYPKDRSSSVRAPHNTYSWSPIVIATATESGDTVTTVARDFGSYLAKLHRWEYWYGLPRDGALSRELFEFYGGAADKNFRVNTQPIATNRYGRPLAVSYTPIIAYPVRRGSLMDAEGTEQTHALGSIVLLPDLPERDSREAVNLVLEEVGFPQTALPPEWVEDLVVPGMPEIDEQIGDKAREIDRLSTEIAQLNVQRGNLEHYRKLLYESGPTLEKIFSDCLAMMGGRVTPAKYSNEEFVLNFDGRRSLVECKGVSKSASLAHVRQLTDYVLVYEEDEGTSGKGVLFVNAWRNLRPVERGTTETPIFPTNVVERATQLGIALVSSVDFFEVLCRFLQGKIDGATVLRTIASTDGIVKFL